jgi:Trm5-related predicted tRNA methylase
MSKKELHDLTTQVKEVYGSNLRAARPFHLMFTNYNCSDQLHHLLTRTLCKDPLELPIDIRNKRLTQLFDKGDIVFLTPDASQPLLTWDSTKVYVVGGLADKTVQKVSVKVYGLYFCPYVYCWSHISSSFCQCTCEEDEMSCPIIRVVPILMV